MKCFKKVDGVEQSIPALLLNFETLKLPESIKLAWCSTLCSARIARFMGMEPNLADEGKMDYQETVLSVVHVIKEMTTIQLQYIITAKKLLKGLRGSVTNTETASSKVYHQK